MPETRRIISRAAWGFRGWKYGAPPAPLDPARVVALMTHYEGAHRVGDQTGPAMMRALDAFFQSGDRGNGDDYVAVAYNYVIDQAGNVFEGRGLYQGGHCTDWNTRSVGVQFHIGGDEQPSAAALEAGIWLRAKLRRSFPRMTRAMTHSDGIPTDCPGHALTEWTHAGMPAPTQEEDMPITDADADKIARAVAGYRMPGPRDLRAKSPKLAWRITSMIESTQCYAVKAWRQAVANAAAIKAVGKAAGISPADLDKIMTAAGAGAREGAEEAIDDKIADNPTVILTPTVGA